MEAATFGSELIAARVAKEKIQALLYKLRMMGVPVISPSVMIVDNESVVKSVSVPESRLKKKHLSICYHAVREAVAAGILRIVWEDGRFNLADVLTKPLTPDKHQALVRKMLFRKLSNMEVEKNTKKK